MAEWVAAADGDDRQARPRRVQKWAARRESTPVVRNLERDGAHRLAPLEHTGFSDSSEVPREQNRYPSPIEAEGNGVVVGGSAGLAVGIHDRHACVAQPHALARAEC